MLIYLFLSSQNINYILCLEIDDLRIYSGGSKEGPSIFSNLRNLPNVPYCTSLMDFLDPPLIDGWMNAGYRHICI